MNIYVGNLPYRISEDELKLAFEAYGEVTTVTLIKDRETGQMRGFGFVEMPNQSEAESAIQGLNDKEFMNRKLVVNQARPREERGGGGERRPGGFNRDRRSGGGGGERRGRPGGGSRRDDW